MPDVPDHVHDYAVAIAYRVDYLGTQNAGGPSQRDPGDADTPPRYLGEARVTVVALACSRCGRMERVPWEAIGSPFAGPTA